MSHCNSRGRRGSVVVVRLLTAEEPDGRQIETVHLPGAETGWRSFMML